jgi:outer membrane lipoprotein carrier protein
MKKTIGSLFYILLALNLSAQTDQSNSILDKTSKVLAGYKSFSTDFIYTGTNMQTDENNTEKGKILIKNDKYHLTLKGSEIYFDGKDVYNYVEKSNEVNITYPEPSKSEKGEFFITNPRDLFKFQSKNFKSKFIAEKVIQGKDCFEIDLYPIDLKTKYSRIKLHIEKSTSHILDVKIFQKDGMQQFIEFVNFKPNIVLADSLFTFDSKKYPGIIVNDMRF